MGSRNPPTGKITWRIENFSRLTERKYHSDTFTIGGCKWVMQRGPFQLDHGESEPGESSSTKKDAQHIFNAQASDWGFTSFKPLSDLQSRSDGFLVDDTLIMEVEIDVRSVVPPVVNAKADNSPSDAVPEFLSDFRIVTQRIPKRLKARLAF